MKHLSLTQKQIIQDAIGSNEFNFYALIGQKLVLYPNTAKARTILITSVVIEHGIIVVSIPSCPQVAFQNDNENRFNRKNPQAPFALQIDKEGNCQLTLVSRGTYPEQYRMMFSFEEFQKEDFKIIP